MEKYSITYLIDKENIETRLSDLDGLINAITLIQLAGKKILTIVLITVKK